jgi:[ribosomal protein S5]-alanine N-acetyltransferase
MVLNGEKVQLRTMTEKQATQRYVDWMNDTKINQYLESRFKKHTIESAKKYIKDMDTSLDDFFCGIFVNNVHVGNIKLTVNNNHKLGGIGFLIGDTDYWHKGYATEAIMLMTQFGFDKLDLNKIHAGVYANNIGSIMALRKAGYKEDGRQERQYLCDGEYVDCIIMSRWRE